MNFANPGILVWLWVVPVFALALWFGLRSRQRRLHRFSALRLDEILTDELSPGRTYMKSFMLIGGLSLVIVSLAQPRLGFEWQELPHGGIDIMVVLDISRSMEATDVQPSRLERAKREIIDLLDMLQGDRLGMVGFAGVPFVHCPLTTDYRLARTFINYISPDLMPVQGTAIADALRLATDRLASSSKGDSEGKAILLITDGEDQESDAIKAAEDAKAKGIKIFSIGVGDAAGAPIPLPGGGFKKDKQGNLVISKMDEETLKKISLATGGTYVRSVSGDMDLENIYQNGMRSKVDDAEVGRSRQKVWFERFQWFLMGALSLIVAEFFFSDVRRRRAATSVLGAFLCASLASSSARADDVKDAVKAFEAKDYDKAAKEFLDAEIDEPNQPAHPYNRGVSQFEAGDFDGAVEGFSKSAGAQDRVISGNSQYNLGNSFVAKGKYEEAIAAYQKALELNPKDVQAKENKEWVEKQLEKQKQNQQNDKNQDNKDQQQNQDNKDQQQNQDNKDQQQNQDNKDQQQNQDNKDQQQNQDNKDQQQKQDNKDQQQKQDNKDQQQNQDNKDQQQNQGDREKDQKGQESNQESSSKKEPQESKDPDKRDAEQLLDSLDSENSDMKPKPRVLPPSKEPERDW